MYPVCREGVSAYLPGIWDWDQDGYPQGDAMVERHGMGALKLDFGRATSTRRGAS